MDLWERSGDQLQACGQDPGTPVEGLASLCSSLLPSLSITPGICSQILLTSKARHTPLELLLYRSHHEPPTVTAPGQPCALCILPNPSPGPSGKHSPTPPSLAELEIQFAPKDRDKDKERGSYGPLPPESLTSGSSKWQGSSGPPWWVPDQVSTFISPSPY